MLVFPFNLPSFFHGLRITVLDFDLSEGTQASRDASGAVFIADHAERLWRGAIEVAPSYHAEAKRMVAKAEALRQAGASFMVGSWAHRFPQDDPAGKITANSSVTVLALNVDNKRLRLAGVPPGVTIQEGDHISWAYGANPVRYALHLVVEGARADAQGNTALIEVRPHIRPGVNVGAPVKLRHPSCKAVIVPGTFQAGSYEANLTDGFSFQFTQTLR